MSGREPSPKWKPNPRYIAARDEHRRKQAAKSPEQRERERREAERFADNMTAKMLAALGRIVLPALIEEIDMATDSYRQLIADRALTADDLAVIGERLRLLTVEHEVATGTVNLP